MKRRQHGQSVAEFALVLPIMLMIAFTTLDLFGFITARGRVFDMAAASLEAVTAAKVPVGPTFGPLEQRDFLCSQVYAAAVGLAVAGHLPHADSLSPTGGCSSTPTDDAPVAVDIIALATFDESVSLGDNPHTDIPFERLPSAYVAGSVDPTIVRVCVSYLWPPQMGLLYLAKGTSLTVSAVNTAMTWTFCGRTALDPRRSY